MSSTTSMIQTSGGGKITLVNCVVNLKGKVVTQDGREVKKIKFKRAQLQIDPHSNGTLQFIVNDNQGKLTNGGVNRIVIEPQTLRRNKAGGFEAISDDESRSEPDPDEYHSEILSPTHTRHKSGKKKQKKKERRKSTDRENNEVEEFDCVAGINTINLENPMDMLEIGDEITPYGDVCYIDDPEWMLEKERCKNISYRKSKLMTRCLLLQEEQDILREDFINICPGEQGSSQVPSLFNAGDKVLQYLFDNMSPYLDNIDLNHFAQVNLTFSSIYRKYIIDKHTSKISEIEHLQLENVRLKGRRLRVMAKHRRELYLFGSKNSWKIKTIVGQEQFKVGD